MQWTVIRMQPQPVCPWPGPGFVSHLGTNHSVRLWLGPPIHFINMSGPLHTYKRTWTPATPHPDANRQCNSTRATYEQNPPKSTQGHGHAVPMAKVSRSTGSISLLLETGNTKPGRLLHKTPPSDTPQECTSNHTNKRERPRIQETLPDARNPTNSKWYQTNSKIGSHSSVHQNSTKDSQVPKHGRSKKCIRILRQGCVRTIHCV